HLRACAARGSSGSSGGARGGGVARLRSLSRRLGTGGHGYAGGQDELGSAELHRRGEIAGVENLTQRINPLRRELAEVVLKDQAVRLDGVLEVAAEEGVIVPPEEDAGQRDAGLRGGCGQRKPVAEGVDNFHFDGGEGVGVHSEILSWERGRRA